MITCPQCGTPVTHVTHRQVDTVVIHLMVPGDTAGESEIERDECEAVLSTRYECANGHAWIPEPQEPDAPREVIDALLNRRACYPLEPD